MDFFLHKVDLARIQNIMVQTTKCENLMLCERMVYLGGVLISWMPSKCNVVKLVIT
jgi:hypothetical protein